MQIIPMSPFLFLNNQKSLKDKKVIDKTCNEKKLPNLKHKQKENFKFDI